jgi:proteasome lid subunit RPN8/RPN11
MTPGTNPSSILIGDAVRETIGLHAIGDYPRECCGILLGHAADHGWIISAALPAANTAEPHRLADRYTLDPRALLAADRRARREGLDILGFYHSHPDHPAIPSRTDIDLAWEFYVYLIASVRDGAVSHWRAWQFHNGVCREADIRRQDAP